MAKLPSQGPVFAQNACVYAGLNTETSTENGMVYLQMKNPSLCGWDFLSCCAVSYMNESRSSILYALLSSFM